jgi:hypothetical protein
MIIVMHDGKRNAESVKSIGMKDDGIRGTRHVFTDGDKSGHIAVSLQRPGQFGAP